ncbi:MBL fold metallo-hydrolase [Pedobacter sp. AW31-3R]|uniref:MBL fold metallo-hydrolase n=1 Tax=Pedobacter sp. AW31-3R TaxID=3445781 RepID=UPI003FA0CD7E
MTTNSLRILGCGDAFASGGQFHTCFYLHTPKAGVLIDCGATVLQSLKKFEVKPEDIDVILITHLHGDHYGGLPYFLMDAAVNKRQKKLTIVTPPTGEARIKALLDLLYPASDKTEKLPVEFLAYAPDQVIRLAGIQVKAFPVVHSQAALSHGLRITIGDKILSYSGDTSWTENLVPLSEGADLFICECNFYHTSTPTHLNYLKLIAEIPRLTCKQILLTHLSEEMLKELPKIELPVAREGMVIKI